MRRPRGSELSAGRRLDIQGLRALAVLLVVAFHMGLPVRGGFIGVDVFFVISGFVITAMLMREWAAEGRVRLGRFYLRRFKRLTPALAVTVSTTLVVAALIMPPFDGQAAAAQTGAGAILLVANFVIAASTGGYFDAPAEANPLLNTWSLSVEEQFYLFFPLVLIGTWTFVKSRASFRWWPAAAVSIVGLFSFLLATYGSQTGSENVLLGFYSPLTRTWEFAVGALLALAGAKLSLRGRPVLALLIGVLGLGLILVSSLALSGDTPFPGPWALPVVVGTAALLVAGTHPGSPTTRLFSSKPAVWVGDLSYSIYLWHWPLIVFALYLLPGSAKAAVFAGLLSLLPALVSYRWVERPIRSRDFQGVGQWRALVLAVVTPPLVLAVAILGSQQTAWADRFEAGEWMAHVGDVGHDKYHAHLNSKYYPCTAADLREYAPVWEGTERCHQSRATSAVEVAVIGDSHAEHLFPGLAEALAAKNVAYYISAEFPRTDHEDVRRILDRVVADPDIETVVFSSYWKAKGIPEGDIHEILSRLTEAGKRVVVTDDVPDFPFDASYCKYRRGVLLPWTVCSEDVERERNRQLTRIEPLREVVSRVPGVDLAEISQAFCDAELCRMAPDGKSLLYRDNDHLNVLGSRWVAELVVDQVDGREAAGR